MVSISAPLSLFTRSESLITKSRFRSSPAETIQVSVNSQPQSISIQRHLAVKNMHLTWPVARLQKWGRRMSWTRQLVSSRPFPSLSHTLSCRPMTSRSSPLQISVGQPISCEFFVGSADIRLRIKHSQAFPLYPSFTPAQRITGSLHSKIPLCIGGRAPKSRSIQGCAAVAEKQQHQSGGDGKGGGGNLAATERLGASPPFMVRAPGQRVVAIGDLHGDWDKSLAALRLAGVVEEDGPIGWAGGATILVQVGDVLDRGSDEVAIMSLLRHLHVQAVKEGGAVYQIIGNHETNNMRGELSTITEGGFVEAYNFVKYCTDEKGGDWGEAFSTWWSASMGRRKEQREGGWRSIPRWISLDHKNASIRVRFLLFRPGGPLALELSRHSVVLLVNETLFAHGGILPHHVKYGLERLNNEVSAWMRGEVSGESVPIAMSVAYGGEHSVVWSRLYSEEKWKSGKEKSMACNALASVLDDVGATRLVVGHTVQMGGANSACGGRVWRIDVGMSSGVMGAPPQVLEIKGDNVRVCGSNRDGYVNTESRL